MKEIKEVLFRIKNIEYNAIDFELENDTDITISYQDIIGNMSFNEKKDAVYFLVTRKIEFDPNILFNLEVSLEFRVEISEEYINSFDIKFIEENVNTLVEKTSAMPRLSNLISNITAAQNNTPIITEPKLSI